MNEIEFLYCDATCGLKSLRKMRFKLKLSAVFSSPEHLLDIAISII